MSKKNLVTGASGLIGSEVCSHFEQLGWEVVGVDNNQRAIFFGSNDDTGWIQKRLEESLNHFSHVETDIWDREGVIELIASVEPDQYVYQMFGIRVENKTEMILHLKSKGIATGCHYTPLSVQPLFSEWGHNCPYIEKETDRCITLPLHIDLSRSDIDYILDAIRIFYSS